MDNAAIAAVFEEMAELLQLSGGDPHRVRAFRRTATVLQMLPKPAVQMMRDGTLQRVRGIGEGAVHRIKQIARSGSCDEHRRLRAALPPGLRELLKLRGLGPTKVRLIHQHLGVGSLAELELAARSGRLAQLPKMGERSVEQIVHAIADHRRLTRRLPLGRALELGRAMLAELLASPAVERAEMVGSLRRRKETIGDIDFVAAVQDPVAAIAHFSTLSPLAEVIARGESICSGRLAGGRQADLWVFPPEEYGAALHAFSGAQVHVVGLRDRANRMDLHISEHGVFRRSDRHRLTSGEREEEIFAAVGLPFIPPELREACGEIDAAERGRLPQLVQESDLRGDLHLHTRDSDGRGSLHEMAEAAAELGLEYIAVTDHSKSLKVARGLDASRLRAQREQIRRLEARSDGVRLLSGIEVDILPDGSLDLEPEPLRSLDWVVASVHSEMGGEEEEMSDRLIRAMESGVVDCIGHPTGRRLGLREAYALDLERVLAAAARLGVAVEINANPGRLDLDSVSCRRARELGVAIVINSDAHSPRELRQRELGVCVARRGWLEARDVLNTRPWQDLAERRRDRLRAPGEVVSVPAMPAPGGEGAEAMGEGLGGEEAGQNTELVQQLSCGELDEALREQLRAYLAGDAEQATLARALARLSDHPMQLAFDLLAGGDNVPKE